MKMLVKNRLNNPICIAPGDHIQVCHTRGDQSRVVADIKVREAGSFNTAFIATLEPGEMGFECGYIGGIVQEKAADFQDAANAAVATLEGLTIN